MTLELPPATIDQRLRQQFPDIQTELGPNWLRVAAQDMLGMFRFLRDDPQLDFVFLSGLAAVDLGDLFEVVYHLQSLQHNHLGVVKVTANRADPIVPSVSGIWWGAELQEAEAYDLMGIRFEGHPNLRRIFLWEGFAGWPLRKDFLQFGEGLKPGLPFFPKEGGETGILSGPNWTAPQQPGKEG